MVGDSTIRRSAAWVALAALFLIPFAPLVVSGAFFFPFITGKAFYLRTLIEIAIAAWILLALMHREYRPRLSAIGAVVIAFVIWMFVADAFAPNATKAFWSNFERMEGWVLLIHLLGFFFATSTVLRVEQKWRAWFLTSLTVSLVVSAYALLQLAGSLEIHQGATRIDASFGNSAYLAIYFLFSVFIAGWLALTEKRAWLKWSLLALAMLESVLIIFTGTRGAILGFVGALSLAALLTIFTAGKRARSLAVSALILIVVLVGVFLAFKETPFIRNSEMLNRVASISLADGATRFTIWGIAFEGVKERPFFGWGQEGFNYVFNAHYKPSLYAQEPWFDRAHNAFIDWLSAGGVPALLLYIALFLSAITLLWRRSELSRPERVALTAALAGYACHNLFVFDNLYSYIYFFAILALIDSQTARPVRAYEEAHELSNDVAAHYALPIILACGLALFWWVNVTGMRAASGLLAAIADTGDINRAHARFERLVEGHPFGRQEIRERLVAYVASVVRSNGGTLEEKQRIAALAIEEMRSEVETYPRDARARMQLAYIYRIVGAHALALKEIEAALELSPEKPGFWIEAGTAKWDLSDSTGAREAFEKAYELAPQFNELALYAAIGAIITRDQESADALLIRTFNTAVVGSDILAIAYASQQNWPRLIAERRAQAENARAGAQEWFALAAAYHASGDRSRAVAIVREAITRFPEAAAAGASLLEQLGAQIAAP